MNNQPSESLKFIIPFVNRLKKEFPLIEVIMVDERFTSKMAFQTMIDGGLKKKDRQNKELVDTISATIILQSYLNQRIK
jgi:putative Holliday junction resolvase